MLRTYDKKKNMQPGGRIDKKRKITVKNLIDTSLRFDCVVLDILSKAIHPKLKLLGHIQKSLSQVQYTLEGSFLAQPFRQVKNKLASSGFSCTSSKTYVY